MVITVHYQVALLGRLYGNHEWLDLGQHGVTIFFVLSGYLITTRLLEEREINLKAFYLRRFFRLMPCAWLYLGTICLLNALIGARLIGNDLWSSLFFFRNFWPGKADWSSVSTGHFWSLSIEEQFYFLWPPILAMLGRKRGLIAACVIVTGVSLFRFTHWSAYNTYPNLCYSQVRFDELCIGCVLAIAFTFEAPRRFFQARGSQLIWLVLPLLCWHIYRYRFLIPLSETLLIALALGCTAMMPQSVFGRVLEFAPLKKLGVISYSLYVWQQIIFRFHFIPVAIAVAFIALFSFEFIEKRFIEIGKALGACC